MGDIGESIAGARTYLREHPDEARSQDPPALAILVEGLRAEASSGQLSVMTDMPEAVGGKGSAPSPGWLFRAALACCDATVFAMRAAELGIVLGELEVEVSSTSDDRGLLGAEDDVPAGPLAIDVRIRASGRGLDDEALRDLHAWIEAHSPVGDVARRSVATSLTIERGQIDL